MNRWFFLGVAFVAMMFIGLYQYSWTMFTVPIKEATGWSMPAIQLTFTICIWIMTWTQPIAGVIADRKGPRKLVFLSALLAGAGWIGSAYASNLETLYFFYGLGGIGAGAIYAVSIGVGNKWFPDRRGFATGLAAAGFGIGAAIFNPILHYIIEENGYQTAFWQIGLIMLIVLIMISLLVKYPPSNWAPPRRVVSTNYASIRSKNSAENYTMKEMISVPQWWLIYFAFCSVASVGLLVASQIKPMGETFALPDSIIVLAAMIFPLVSGLGRPLGGWISDRIGRQKTMTLYFLILGLCCVFLLFGGTHPVAFILLVALIGFFWGPIFAFFPGIIGDNYGTKHVTGNYGLTYTAKGWGGLLGGWVASFLAVKYGGFTISILMAAFLSFLAAALICPKILKKQTKKLG